MKNISYGLIAFIGLLMMCAECEDLNTFVYTKVAGLILFIGGFYLTESPSANQNGYKSYKKRL